MFIKTNEIEIKNQTHVKQTIGKTRRPESDISRCSGTIPPLYLSEVQSIMSSVVSWNLSNRGLHLSKTVPCELKNMRTNQLRNIVNKSR